MGIYRITRLLRNMFTISAQEVSWVMKRRSRKKDWFVAKAPGMSIYLQYKDNLDELMKLALTMDIAENWKKAHPQERIIVYSPACFLEEDYLRDSRIEFVSIPYGLYTKTRDEV